MNEEYELNDIDDLPEEESYEAPRVPEFATKDDLRAFAEQLLGELKTHQPPDRGSEPEFDDPLAGYDDDFVNDMRRAMDQQAQALHAQYAPLLSAGIANQAVELVAGDMGAEAQKYIGKVISLMDSQAAKAMLNDPVGLEMLHNMAIGHQSKCESSHRAPRTHEPGGAELDSSFSDADKAGMSSFMKAFGVDRKRATELYRDAQKAGR